MTRTPLSRSKGKRSTCRGLEHIVAASHTTYYIRTEERFATNGVHSSDSNWDKRETDINPPPGHTSLVDSNPLPLLSVFRLKISQVHPSDRLPFPLEFRSHDMYLKTRVVWLWLPGREKKLDDVVKHFDTIHECDNDRQTDRHTTTASTALMHSIAR